jgi:hypothetical protein
MRRMRGNDDLGRVAWLRAAVAVSLLALAGAGCSRRSGPAPDPSVLAPAIGASGACRVFPAAGAWNPRDYSTGSWVGSPFEGGWQTRDPSQSKAEAALLYAVLAGWLMSANADGAPVGTFSEPFHVRVDVLKQGSGAVARATVEYMNRSATLTLGAARRAEGDPLVTLFAMAVDDPKRTVAVGTIDANGRISFTGCGEAWSYPPLPGGQPRPPSVEDGAPLTIATTERFFGGRTPAWWQTRLAELRRDGPPKLYALALQRARAAGLAVAERADGLAVEPPPRGVYR